MTYFLMFLLGLGLGLIFDVSAGVVWDMARDQYRQFKAGRKGELHDLTARLCHLEYLVKGNGGPYPTNVELKHQIEALKDSVEILTKKLPLQKEVLPKKTRKNYKQCPECVSGMVYVSNPNSSRGMVLRCCGECSGLGYLP